MVLHNHRWHSWHSWVTLWTFTPVSVAGLDKMVPVKHLNGFVGKGWKYEVKMHVYFTGEDIEREDWAGKGEGNLFSCRTETDLCWYVICSCIFLTSFFLQGNINFFKNYFILLALFKHTVTKCFKVWIKSHIKEKRQTCQHWLTFSPTYTQLQ